MPPDVAGATFMAAGSSGPELATAVIGVFVAKVIFVLFMVYLVIRSTSFHNPHVLTSLKYYKIILLYLYLVL